MDPCYILTYFLEGECAVDVNSIRESEERGANNCMLTFKDGSTLQLEETCDDFYIKKPRCRKASQIPSGISIFPAPIE